MKRFQLVIVILAVAACSPKVDVRGYVADGDIKDKIAIGRTTKDEVLAALGSPSAQSTFGDEAWYYIAARQETVAFLKPETAEQNVTRIAFDGSGVVSDIQTYDKTAGREFAVVKRTTPTEGHSMNMVEQMLGNIGRFNKPGGDTGIATGRKPGGRY